MNKSLNKFYLNTYLQTGGFIPVFPVGNQLDIGDFFVIENREIFKLVSLAKNEEFFDLEEPVIQSRDITVPHEIWQTQHAINTSFKSRGAAFEWENIYLNEMQQALIIEFTDPGSYFFRTGEVITRRFENFFKLSNQILQKFVSKEFNFKKIYFVNEVASTDDCALSVSDKYGNLVVDFAEEGYYGLDDLVTPGISFLPHQSKNLAYNKLRESGCNFIKAVRLDMSFQGEHHVSQHIRNHLPKNMQKYYHNLLNYGKTNVLKLTNIFPGNASDYYSFFPMGLEDIEQLFD